MGLSKDVRDKLEARLDFDRDCKLKAVVTKAETIKAPILIVGLGGTGVDALIRTKKMINTRINCKSPSGEWKEKPDNVEYLAIDTDDANEQAEYEGIKLNKELEEFFLFQNRDIAKILKARKTFLMEDADEWLCEDLPISSIIHGARGVRQAGRLMLFLNSNIIIDAIRKKISRVTRGYGANVPISVFILAGISGGTGSGTFIDIPYMIRKVAEEYSRNVENIGLLFLPDVSLINVGIGNDVIAANIKRNGYAALKELDYLMNMERSKDYFEQGYGPNFKVNKTNEGPFNICLFISSRDSDGTIYSDSPYEYALSIAAETVVNFIAFEEADNGGKFTINSFISNIMSNGSTFVNSLGSAKHPVNYIYNVVGASTAFLPIDDLMSYMTYIMFEEAERLYNSDPTERDVEEMVRNLGLDEGAVEREFRRAMPPRPDFVSYTFEKIRQASSALETEYKGVTKRQIEVLNNMVETKVKDFEVLLKDKNNIINTYFKDINKGPVFTQLLLYNPAGSNSVSSYLERTRLRLLGRRFDSIQLDAYEAEMKSALSDLMNKGLLEHKKKVRENYAKACDKYYNAILTNHVLECMAAAYAKIYKLVLEVNNEIYSSIAELFETLKKLFQKYGKINTATSIQYSDNNTVLSWYLVSAPEFISEIMGRMQTDPYLRIDFAKVVRLFYQNLIENPELWTGKTRADVVDAINEYISESFKNILDKGMDYYMEFIAMHQGKSRSSFYGEILQELNKKAKVMFPMKPEMGGMPISAPRYTVLSIPENAPQILNAAMLYMSGKKSQVKKSGISERVFMLNFDIAIPLYEYAELDQCEDAYEASIMTNGIHLYEKNKNWKSLPSPNFETTWTSGHKNPREAKINAEYKTIFDKAKEYGYIVYDPGILTFICKYGDLVGWEGILKDQQIDLDSEFNDAVKVTKCLNIIREKLTGSQRMMSSFKLYDIVFLEDGVTPNDEYAKNIFIKMIGGRERIAEMVKNHEACLNVIEKLKKYENITLLIRQFIRCIYTGCIVKNSSKYIAKDGAEKNLYQFHGIEDQYIEFYTFHGFLTMEEKIRDEMILRALKQKDSVSEETRSKIIESLEQFADRMQENRNELNENYLGVKDQGIAKLQFYQMITEEAKHELFTFRNLY
ncbi:MAG: tubulin-like protein [Herbinix sp.]|jgi:hypothetical protein|nr:tubulin-like protein [Herbinix sp.]